MVVKTKGTIDKISRKELKFATEFIFAHLVSKKIHDSTEITIKSIKTNDDHKEMGKLFGKTYQLDQYKYRIDLNKDLSRKIILQTLAHELVHVKQYTKKQLGVTYMIDGSYFGIWKKKSFNMDGLNYFFTPWEVEAAGKENGLYQVYEHYIYNANLKF